MKIQILLVGMALIGPLTHPGYSQTTADTTQNRAAKPVEKKFQAKAPKTQPFGVAAFGPSKQTTIRWLGFAGFFVNSRGTMFMVDPVLEGFDMPVLIAFPIAPKAVPKLDAILVTHADNDHFSVPTNQNLKGVTKTYHSTIYVDSLMQNLGLPAFGHTIGDSFQSCTS